jgi:hypothetical protein
MADYIGQEYKDGGITRTKVMTQAAVTIPAPPRPTGTTTTADNGSVTITPPDILDISDYQNAKKIVDYKIQHQIKNRQNVSLSYGYSAPNPCTPRSKPTVTIKRLKEHSTALNYYA